LEPQRQELRFAQLAGEKASGLVAELRDALLHQLLV